MTNKKLFADKYQVETLMELCRPAAQAVNCENVIQRVSLAIIKPIESIS